MTRDEFLRILFDDGQQTCFAADAKGVAIKPGPGPNDLFFSINAMDPKTDHFPIEHYHAANKPRRADHNVICYRNFLIEIDNMPLSEQLAYVQDKVPVSSIVFSGSKSYHFIISLEQPVTATQYAKIASGLHRLLPAADSATKNPSRLSRLPWAVRPDTRLVQELLYLGSRIPLSKLPEPPASKHTPTHLQKVQNPNVLYVNKQLAQVRTVGVDTYIAEHFAGRNQFFYWLGRRSQELKQTREQKRELVEAYYNMLNNKSGFSIREAYMAARVRHGK